METMKKSYHSACKEEKLAASRETNSKLESNNPEAQKKLQEKVEKCQQEVQKVGLPLEKKTRWGVKIVLSYLNLWECKMQPALLKSFCHAFCEYVWVYSMYV